MLAGTSSERILEAAKVMVNRQRGWVNPFGDGKTAQKIISILLKQQLLEREESNCEGSNQKTCSLIISE